MFTTYGTKISWKACLYKVVVLSTTEAKYLFVIKVVKEALWLKRIVEELKVQNQVIIIYFDNNNLLPLLENQVNNNVILLTPRCIFYERRLLDGLLKWWRSQKTIIILIWLQKNYFFFIVGSDLFNWRLSLWLTYAHSQVIPKSFILNQSRYFVDICWLK